MASLLTALLLIKSWLSGMLTSMLTRLLIWMTELQSQSSEIIPTLGLINLSNTNLNKNKSTN